MKVFVGFEFSGRVRDAFIKKGHDAISCDKKESLLPGPHIIGDVYEQDLTGYDLIIMHPVCTCLGVSGNGTYAKGKPKHYLRIEAAIQTEKLWEKCIKICKAVCFENPVGVLPTLTNMGKPQYIHPHMFGHPETKKTGLWLHGLDELKPTTPDLKPEYIIGKDGKRYSRIHYLSRGSSQKYYGMDRATVRGLTFPGIAEAFADQWSGENL